MLEGLSENNPCVLYYRGLVCSTFIPEEPETGNLRPECAAFEETHSMRKISAISVDGRTLPSHLHRHPKQTFELAFFQLDLTPQSQMSPGVQ